MKLIVGLGNYGDEYKGTKHNLGFEVVDELKPKIQREGQLKSELNKKMALEIFYGHLGEEQVDLIKPQTYMNNSGWAVSKFAKTRKLETANDFIVIHDDITLELGKIKISVGSGAGSHNGVQSIIDHLGTKDFIRVRLGIGRGEGVLHEVVLSKFRPDEKELVEGMINKAADACEAIVRNGLEKAMNTYNRD